MMDMSIDQPYGEDFFWSKEYILVIDQNFEDLFKHIYEDQFIEKIFGPGGDAKISRSNFISSITNPVNAFSRADWIFKPKMLRTCFQENIDLILVQEEIQTINIDQSFSSHQRVKSGNLKLNL